MYKQHEIVLLESNEPSHIHFIPKGEYEKIGEDLVSIKENRLLFEEESSEYSYTPMHLYILNNNKIQQGDYIKWYVKPLNKEWISQVTKEDIDYYENMNNQGKKVIATTNKVITSDFSTRGTTFVPTMPLSFIEYYVSEYNNGNIIKTVEVEYYNSKNIGAYNEIELEGNLVTNSSNEISIKLIKISWNREEVIELLNKFEKRFI